MALVRLRIAHPPLSREDEPQPYFEDGFSNGGALLEHPSLEDLRHRFLAAHRATESSNLNSVGYLKLQLELFEYYML